MNVGRVVIIDDDPELRRATRLVLTKAGYDAFEAADGEQGIAVIRSGDPPINGSHRLFPCPLSLGAGHRDDRDRGPQHRDRIV